MEKPARLSPVRVAGASMEPTLPDGALVAVRDASGALTVGSVVVVRRPGGREDVKRIAAAPGDVFAGRTLTSEEYAVTGDNASASTDSRHYGPVTTGEIVAVVRFCYWPPRAWKRL